MARWSVLTPRHADVLDTLMVHGDWARPMDVGAFSGSHHSSTLAALFRKGFAERKVAGGGWARSAYRYRITEEGRAALGEFAVDR